MVDSTNEDIIVAVVALETSKDNREYGFALHHLDMQDTIAAFLITTRPSSFGGDKRGR